MHETRLALITGANKGIGFETAKQLARMGIWTVLGARDEKKGAAAAARLREEGLAAEHVPLDVTDSGHIRTVREYLENTFGRLDILVNNAGMVHPEENVFSQTATTISPSALRETFAVNFFGVVELTQALLPLLRKSPAGRIVNISSMLGSLTLHSSPAAGLDDVKPFAYDASKTALNQFTVHLAAELRDTPIKVNSAHPGWVKTDLGGEEAPMEVADGARTGVTLATLPPDGPTGKFFHMDDEMPW